MSSIHNSEKESKSHSNLKIQLIQPLPISNDENIDSNSPTKLQSKRRSISFQPSNTSPLKVHSARCERSKQSKTKNRRKSISSDQNQSLLIPLNSKHVRSNAVSTNNTKLPYDRNGSNPKQHQKITRLIREKNEYKQELRKYKKENERLNKIQNHLNYKIKVLFQKTINQYDEINDNQMDKDKDKNKYEDDDIFQMIDKLISNSILNEEKGEKLLQQIGSLKLKNQRKSNENKGFELEEKSIKTIQIAMIDDIGSNQKPENVTFFLCISVFLISSNSALCI